MTCSDDVFCIILEKPQREKERHEVEKKNASKRSQADEDNGSEVSLPT